jgi:hypothetical protein
MEHIASVASFSALLLAAAAVLLVWHVRSWRAFQRQDLDAEDFDYRRRQFRRRMQTSAMLGALGVAVLVGYVFMAWHLSPVLVAIYWIVVVLVVFWVGLLGLVDIWGTKYHFGRIRDRYLVEQAKLRAEIHRIQAIRGNGHGETIPQQEGEKPEGEKGKG